MNHFQAATLLGAAAAVTSIASFAPQAWKIIITRDVSGVSKSMYCLTVATFGLWLTYGLVLSNWALIISNLICLILAGFILFILLLSPHRRAKIAQAIESGREGPKQ